MEVFFNEQDIRKIAEKTANIVISHLSNFSKKPNSDITYYTKVETAGILGITKPTLDKYCKQGLIPSYRINRRILFKKSEIEDAVNQGLRYSHNRNGGIK